MLDATRSVPAPGGAAGLRVHGLQKAYGSGAVLRGIDLDVARGTLVTVLGASGSGKTTLLRLVCGFERADAGAIELGGRTVARGRSMHLPPERRDVGYVAQEGALFPHLSVAENILFGLPRRVRRSAREGTARARQLLELMDLPADYAPRAPAALSGGEQQRVALARALAPGPALVLLDEPFSALDAGLRIDTRAAVVASLKRAGATALLVTHDQDEALSMSDRVAVLQGGRLVQTAAPQTLYRFPVNAAVARFVGEAVLVPGSLDGDAVECCFGHLPVAPTARGLPAVPRAVDVMVRPEQIRLEAEDGRPGDGYAHAARVENVSFYGHDARVALRLGCGVRFTASVPGIDLPAPGANVRARVVGPVVVYARGDAADAARPASRTVPSGQRNESSTIPDRDARRAPVDGRS